MPGKASHKLRSRARRLFNQPGGTGIQVPPGHKVAIMAKVNLSVSVKEEHRPRFAELVKQLKKTGLQVEQDLHSAGVVTGSIESEKRDQLKTLAAASHPQASLTVRTTP